MPKATGDNLSVDDYGSSNDKPSIQIFRKRLEGIRQLMLVIRQIFQYFRPDYADLGKFMFVNLVMIFDKITAASLHPVVLDSIQKSGRS
ncbi:hypothetical protein [Paenibacillus phocaensis]|uniref:hypothetical protein n=1 Tax=Paenibacillus phocaensis TaxID=1776378 RepID=UPI0018E20AB5|nr:hypothetical protein [Paenibacillus phocaensis]